jgi:hypothetical protein
VAVRFAALVVMVFACGGDAEQGVFTESECPAVAPPTYASFGEAFFADYCNRCHSQALTGLDREGAPPTIDFDTESLVRENTSRIDKQAAFGPAAMNTLMPIGAPTPTDAERLDLGRFIACEVAR